MSHFVTLVLVESDKAKTLGSLQERLSELLGPFDENAEVPEYEQECWCVGVAAKHAARSAAALAVGSINSLRESFGAKIREVFPDLLGKDPRDYTDEEDAATDKLWQEHLSAFKAVEDATLEAHPLKGEPTPDCEDCGGSGKHSTTCNPNAKWDWWTIGGRWTGYLSGYDPRTDIANRETCDLCAGTGRRDDAVGRQARIDDPKFTCNGCGGVGIRGPTQWARHPGDIMEVPRVLSKVVADPKAVPFAVLTPDGEWHEKGEMGWFGVVRGKKDQGDWTAQVKNLLEVNLSCTAVVIDCHI